MSDTFTPVLLDGPITNPDRGTIEAGAIYKNLGFTHTLRCGVSRVHDYPENSFCIVQVWNRPAQEWHEVLSWSGLSAMMKLATFTEEGIRGLFDRMLEQALTVLEES